MKVRRVMMGVAGSLVLSGAALAQGGAGMGMHGWMMGDGNAKVTKEEFMKRAEERFAQMDFNKDGVIDASDREQMYKRMQSCMGTMGGMGMMWGYPGMMWGAPGMMQGGPDTSGSPEGGAPPKP
jgi:hypothetical protein